MAILGIVVGVLLALLLVVPLVVPIPPLRDTVPPEELADPDSRFADIAGVRVHFKRSGEGQPGFVLLHGFGASTFSWREVFGAFSTWGRTIAFDRPGFGLTERPLAWQGANPYATEAEVALTVGLMDALEIERVVLVGHSAGGGVALRTALAHPERVAALVLVSPAVGRGSPLPVWMRPLLSTPQARRLGPLLVRRIRDQGPKILRLSWHDPSRISPVVLAGYERPLRAENWDRALWELVLAAEPVPIASRLDELKVPVLVVTGDDDRIVPLDASRRLAERIPGAAFVALPACGHLPHEEQPAEFLEVVEIFLARHVLSPSSGDRATTP